MHKINPDKIQMLSDTVQNCGGWVLRSWVWFLGRELGRPSPAAWGTRRFCRTNVNSAFTFHLSGVELVKAEILFRLLSISKNRC